MALSEETVIGEIGVVDCGNWKSVLVKTVTKILRDGVEISSSNHRHIVQPTDDYSSEDASVKSVCDLFHTDSAKAAYAAAMAESGD